MNIIICIGKKNGILFNKRRISRDKEVINRILKFTDGQIYVSEYSAQLFEDNKEQIIIIDSPLNNTPAGGYCFVEEDIPSNRENIEQIIVFNWNKKYPADTYLTLPIQSEFQLISTEEFQGKSHDKITMEVFK